MKIPRRIKSLFKRNKEFNLHLDSYRQGLVYENGGWFAPLDPDYLGVEIHPVEETSASISYAHYETSGTANNASPHKHSFVIDHDVIYEQPIPKRRAFAYCECGKTLDETEIEAALNALE